MTMQNKQIQEPSSNSKTSQDLLHPKTSLEQGVDRQVLLDWKMIWSWKSPLLLAALFEY